RHHAFFKFLEADCATILFNSRPYIIVQDLLNFLLYIGTLKIYILIGYHMLKLQVGFHRSLHELFQDGFDIIPIAVCSFGYGYEITCEKYAIDEVEFKQLAGKW